MKPPKFTRTLPTEKINAFLESRSQRDKTLILVAFFAALLALDYWVWMGPLMGAISKNTPELGARAAVLGALRDDQKNQGQIEVGWIKSKSMLVEKNARFISHTEIPSLLEKLSDLARSSHVKIISITPLETADSGMGFTRVPIQMSGVAGTHEFGRFLASLESGPVYFRVTNLQIMSNSTDEKRHIVELSLETYATSI